MKKRLFIAHMVNIDGIFSIREKIESLNIYGKWVESENLHFTYRFLGDFEVERIEALKFELKNKLEGLKAPRVEYKGLGVFPNIMYPKVLWIGVNSDEVGYVKRRVDFALKELGFNFEKKPFKPHVTLVRIKKLRHRTKFKSLLFSMREKVFLEGVACTVSLMESKLTKEGPLYRELLKVELEK